MRALAKQNLSDTFDFVGCYALLLFDIDIELIKYCMRVAFFGSIIAIIWRVYGIIVNLYLYLAKANFGFAISIINLNVLSDVSTIAMNVFRFIWWWFWSQCAVANVCCVTI